MMRRRQATLRHADDRLDEGQEMLIEAFGSFFTKHSDPDRVRAASPSGFDADLWRQLNEMRPVAMGVPESQGGDGAGLLELLLVAEQLGRRIAPVPLIEAMVAARLAAQSPEAGELDWLPDVFDGSKIATIALHPAVTGHAQLVPSAGVADIVLGVVGDDLVAITLDQPPRIVANQAGSPLAWVDLHADGSARQVLLSGDAARAAWSAARREWQLLMAGALTGIAHYSVSVGVEYTSSRRAFGVPIGSFQAVAHALVDAFMDADAAERIARRAAWWADTDPTANRHLVPMAALAAVEAADRAARTGIHVLGGVGFTIESELELYFRRAKGWPLVAGDPQRELDAIADELYGPIDDEIPTPSEMEVRS